VHKQPVIQVPRVCLHDGIVRDAYALISEDVVEQTVLQTVLKQHPAQTVYVSKLNGGEVVEVHHTP
jgi:hypothetical protein